MERNQQLGGSAALITASPHTAKRRTLTTQEKDELAELAYGCIKDLLAAAAPAEMDSHIRAELKRQCFEYEQSRGTRKRRK